MGNWYFIPQNWLKVIWCIYSFFLWSSKISKLSEATKISKLTPNLQNVQKKQKKTFRVFDFPTPLPSSRFFPGTRPKKSIFLQKFPSWDHKSWKWSQKKNVLLFKISKLDPNFQAKNPRQPDTQKTILLCTKNEVHSRYVSFMARSFL